MINLNTPPSPNLPYAPQEWSAQYQEQLNNVLRLYFNRLSNVNQFLLGMSGGRFLSNPCGSFFSNSDQSAASTTVAYAITYDVEDIANDVNLSNGSRLNVLYEGIYNLQFSIQFENSDTQIHDVDVWAAINGTNLSNSNSKFSVPNRHGGVNGHLIAALNLFVTMQAGDYVELYWRTSDTAVTVEQTPVSASPTRPATPSVITTMNFVSSISG